MDSLACSVARIVRCVKSGARPALAWMLVFAMVVGLMPVGSIRAMADEAVPVVQEALAQPAPEQLEPATDEEFEVIPSDEREAVQDVVEDEEAVTVEQDEATVDVAPEDEAAAEDTQANEAEAEAEAEENKADDEADQPTTLKYEDDQLIVTAEAPEGVLPEGATLEAEEIHPTSAEKADAYGEALSSLAETLREEDKTYSAAHVYDIRILDADGTEIEPSCDVKVTLSYKQALSLGDVDMEETQVDEAVVTAPVADVAHLTNEGELQMMGAELATTDEGAVEGAEFVTDSFSYYIVFGTNAGSTTEPINIGNYGWLRFGTSGNQNTNWGTYTANTLPAIGTNNAYRRIMQVRLWNLNNGGNESQHDSSNYTMVNDAMYFWTWENQIIVEEFDLPNHEVVWTSMHTAWDDPSNDRANDSLVDTYEVRGYQSSDQTSSDLNVLDIYIKPSPKNQTDMRYVVRYVHADGSISDGNVRSIANGGSSVSFSAASHRRDDEVYAGMSILAGAYAFSDLNEEVGTGTISYNPNIDIAKVYIYYKNAPTNNGNPNTRGRYDYENGQYYTGAVGLYTEKNAEHIDSDKTRDFMINLESWYVDQPASVGMVLDASGSMAWTAGTPTPIQKSNNEWRQLLGNNWSQYNSASNPIPANLLANVLDRTMTDNTTMGYNGFHYYVYDNRSTIQEYVALGYSEDTKSGNNTTPAADGTITPSSSLGRPVYSRRYNGPGWYFVNSQHNDLAVTGKSYEGMNGAGGPARFYIQNGQLWCQFWDGESANGQNVIKYSQVYEKRDTMFTKTETLQDAVAQFGAILLGVSPTSQIGMTRFSTSKTDQLPNNHHVIQNWTSSSIDVADALDQPRGSSFATTTGYVPASGSNLAFSEYVYGLTAQTNTYRGIDAYSTYLKGRATGINHKYVIIFTDGKDTNGDADKPNSNPPWGTAGAQVKALKDDGYTVITVLMKSLAMDTNGEYETASAFLQGLASGGKNGDPNEPLYFEASSDSAHDMVEQFRDIAEHIVIGLKDYTVRDYIDPRFDVVNNAGDVLSVLDEDGNFTEGVETTGEYRSLRLFTSPDGKQAALGYDTVRHMFYVVWRHQDVPSTAIGSAEVVNLWRGQVHVRAKEDFLGGNDVLTNGNEHELNTIYKPRTNDPMAIDTTKTYKDFPFASVNPGLLDVALGNYEDTIFLGEEIKPGELLSVIAKDAAAKERTDTAHRVADTVYNAETMAALGDTDQSSIWYVEYLERLGKKLHNNKDYYGTILEHLTLTGNTGVDRLVTELENTSLYTFSTNNGVVTATGKANTKAAGEKIIIDKNAAKITLELPYYYLESPTDPSTYAGRDRANEVDPQDDKVGTITYTWECKDFAGNVPAQDTKSEGNKFVTFDTYVSKTQHMDTTKAVQYQLGISYMPDPVLDAATGDDGSTRTKALTGQTSVAQPLIRNAVGTEWTEAKSTGADQGWAVIHAVDGRILVEKRMLTADLEQMRADAPDASITLTLTGNNITSAPANEVVWTKTLAVSAATDLRVEGDYTYIVSEWATGLPQGAYTLTETVTDKFGTPVIEGVDDVAFWTLDNSDNDPAKPYADAPSTWRAAYSGSVTWNIGTANSTTCSYTDTDYSYGMVEGDLAQATHKNVDPLLSANAGKAYLNAQLGRARVTNAPAKTSITVTKVWEGATPNAPIVIQLTGSDGTTRYAELNAGNSWSHTFTGLPINNTTYTAVEGIGTVTDETHASFSALETGAAGFDLDDKHYKQASVVYKDKDGANIAANQITGNVAPLAGSVTFTNQALTKVKVTKVWEGITPTQPIVIKLTSTGEADRFVQLGTDSWEYTWEDLPVAANRTYAIVEGTGTVASNGTCPDFRAFDTSADNFTFDNKTYRQKSLTYTPAGGQTGTSPLACVSPDSGAAEVINEALTKVEVKKEWAEGSTKSAIVVELKDSDNNKTYVELNEGNGYAHAFENLKVKEGLTYTVTEGTGTVNASDGTCANFSAIEGVYTVRGEKMKRLSIEYYSNAEATTKATPQSLNGAISPYGGKAVVTNGPVQAKVTLKKVESTDHDKTIAGVTFNLLTGDDFATATAVATNPVTTGDDGTVDLGALKPGTYWLVEASAPDGYVLRDADDPIKLVVDDEGNATLGESIKPGSQYPAPELTQNEGGEYELMVPNMRLYALPAAGGPGAYPFLLIGAFVAALSMSETFGGKRRRATAFGRHSQHGGKGWW